MAGVNKQSFEQCFSYFESYVEMYSGSDFKGFDNYFLKKEEGYKYEVYENARKSLNLESWKQEDIGKGYIAECFKSAYKHKGNLVFYRSDNKTELQIEKNIKETEALLYNLYLTEENEKSFEKAVDIFGGRYDFIAFLFFIKDKEQFLPISPKHFEESFKLLGIEISLQYNCSWENYSEYLNIIANIKNEFQNQSGIEITLLDAHSFVWMINQSKKHFITKEMWIKILQEDTLLKSDDIDYIKDFYNEPQHKSTCSEMSEKTGVPVSRYNLSIGKAGKRIAKHLNFRPNFREDGGERGWSVLFRGYYREDHHFWWQVKPELVDALENVYPELRLNQNAISNIKENITVLFAEFEADNEEKLEINLNENDIKSNFQEFVGVPREKPELIETKQGKRYKRDKQRSINALYRANYSCEYDTTHKSFLRKSLSVNYTESHHLVPMAFQERFSVTLDTEANIVSLCSNCHNQIHYGQDADKLIEKLYNLRKEALENEGIVITLDQLLAMY